MLKVNMENTIGMNNSNKKLNRRRNYHRTYNNKQNVRSYNKSNTGYLEELKNCKAFQLNLSDFTVLFKFFILILRLFTFIFFTVFYIIKNIFILIINLSKKYTKFRVFIIILLLFCILGAIDFIAFYGKVYPGVHIGNIDVSNKTIEETQKLIDDEFSSKLSNNTAVVFVSEEAKNQGINDYEQKALAEQVSLDQAKKLTKYIKISSDELESQLQSKSIANDAINSTRGLNNIFNRLEALFFGINIMPYASFNSSAIDKITDNLNDIAGVKVLNPQVVIQDGTAIASQGHDGEIISKNEFENQLNTAFFSDDSNNKNFIINLHHANQEISFDTAEKFAKLLNNYLSVNFVFSYKDEEWKADKNNLSKWININLENIQEQDNFGCSKKETSYKYLCGSLNEKQITTDIFTLTREFISSDDYKVHFEKNSDNEINVKCDGNAEIPSINNVIEQIKNNWFDKVIVYDDDKKNEASLNKTIQNNINVDIRSTNLPNSLSVDDAINYGIISEISSYTTTYSSGAGTENRNHNIALVASKLNNSICTSDGGTWSFNNTAGDCTPEGGYLEAGAVVGNTYTKSVGGGVCQVATTIFNAVYDAGFKITSRVNHDLYIASYPAGRDAAISYPYPDLVWKNNENSDVLLHVSADGFTVKCSLLGIDPGYSVKTETGEWKEGDNFKTEYVIDNSKSPNSKYTQTIGSKGRSIVIKRTVYDKKGNVLFTDVFTSNYKPKSEIIVMGPGDEANKLLSQNNARMKNENDNW